MRRKFLATLIFSLLFMVGFLFVPRNIQAVDECTEFAVTPTTNLSTATVFTATAVGCNIGDPYWIRVLDANDPYGDPIITTPLILAKAPNGELVFSFSGFPSSGTYIIQLVYTQTNPVAVAEITITIEDSLSCYSIVGQNTATCAEGEVGTDCCPANCPSVQCIQASCYDPNDPVPCCDPMQGQWICAGEDNDAIGATYKCITGGLNGVDSAIGCIPIEANVPLMVFMIRWAMGIAAGIAFLLIIYASFLIITSSGNPKKIAAGKELLYSAITGIILLVFAVWLLRVVGADILGIFPA